LINLVLSMLIALDLLGIPRFEPEDTGKKPNLQLAVISDTHIQSNKPRNTQKLTTALTDIKQIAPNYDAIAVGGDMTDRGFPEDYDLFNSIFHKNLNPRAKQFMVMGNHEWFEKNGNTTSNVTDQQLANRFKEKMNVPNIYYDKWINGYHFITIAGEKSKATLMADNHKVSDADSAYISNEQFEWLEKTLALDTNPSKPIFLFLHQPITNTVYGSEFGAGFQDQKLLAMLKKYPQVILFSGHSHYPLNDPKSIVEDGITMVNTSAIAYTYTKDTGSNATQSQGYIVNVYDNRIEFKAREFSTGTWIKTITIPLHPKTQPITQTGLPIHPSIAWARLNKNRYINWYASRIDLIS
jgi:Icc protein